jgi:hypothetical protein
MVLGVAYGFYDLCNSGFSISSKPLLQTFLGYAVKNPNPTNIAPYGFIDILFHCPGVGKDLAIHSKTRDSFHCLPDLQGNSRMTCFYDIYSEIVQKMCYFQLLVDGKVHLRGLLPLPQRRIQ